MGVTTNIFFCCLVIFSTCEAYKILMMNPAPSRSHGILGDGIIGPLLKAGHEVTYVSAFLSKNKSPNLRQVDITDNLKLMPAGAIHLKELLNKPTMTEDKELMFHFMTLFAVKTVENPNFQKILNDPTEQFDVIVATWMFSDLLTGLGPIFGCPFIFFSPVEVNSGILSMIDSAPNPAYSTDVFSTIMPPFTFTQRVSELFKRIQGRYYAYMYYNAVEEKEYDRLVTPLILKRGGQPRSYSEARTNISLVLGNSHISMGLPVSLPQIYKPIGGFHIKENIDPLPEDLKKIMEGNKNGVIYFSMGSNLQSKTWPEEIKTGLLEMFSKLKQTVLWKFEEDLPNVPKNVHILKWAPQPSILSHPNCVLFISHGGLLSTTETIHYGVPVIGIPVFGDQFTNIKRAVSKGFAIEVNLSYKLVDDLKVAIQEVISNPRYTKIVKNLSLVYHDRPVKPSVEVVHWVEHVVRTRGAPHLRSLVLQVPFYQRLYLDLAALVAASLLMLLVLLKFLRAKLCSKSKGDSKKKSN